MTQTWLGQATVWSWPVAQNREPQGPQAHLAEQKIENPGKSRKNADLGCGGLGGIFTVNFKKRVPQKLRRIILLHFGPVTLDLSLFDPRHETRVFQVH